MSIDTSTGKATGEAYNWRMAEGQFSVIYLDRPDSPSDPNAANLALDRICEQALARITGAKGKLLNETSISLSGHPGRQLRIELPDSLLTVRVYLVGNRVYQLLLTLSRTQESQEAVAVKILDSFKFLTPADAETARKIKIAEATPAPLPQQPVVKRSRSDIKKP